MNKHLTILEFLESTDNEVRIFDLGRRIIEISRADFLSFEQCKTAYPQPLQRQAWLGLLFHQPSSANEPVIWFLRFPLDEIGQLVPAARDDFLHQLFEQAATQTSESQPPTAPEDNPYSFSPKENRRAMFHAIASMQLERPASQYYQHAKQYFSGELGWDQWPFVGFQGIADVAIRLAQDDNLDSLITAVDKIPAEPFIAICQCLENIQIPANLADSIHNRTVTTLRQPTTINPSEIAAGIRGLSFAKDPGKVNMLVNRVLQHPVSTDPEVLAAIAARAWVQLQDATLRTAYMERLANNTGGENYFAQILTDLLFVPGMREPILESLREPDRSETLSQAIGHFFKTVPKG